MGLDEQRAATLALEALHHLPSIVLVLLGIGADQRDGLVAQVGGRPDRAIPGVHEVGAAARMRLDAGLDQGDQLVTLGVDHGDLVARVGGDQEVAARRVEPAVVQEALGLDRGHLEVVDVLVVDHEDVAGFLDVDDELGIVVRGHDRGHARLGVEFLGVVGHAAGRDDLDRLERGAVHDHVLGRPVGTCDRVLVLPALHLRGLDRARLHADLDPRHGLRRVHPQVDQVELGVAPDREEIAARGRHARDVHGIAGGQDLDDLLGVAVDQGDLARVAQRDREEVVEVQLAHLLLRPLVDRHQDLPCGLDLGQAEFRRLRRLVEQITGHQIDILLGQIARSAPIGHAGRGAVVDEGLEVLEAQLLRKVGGERLACRALAQHAMTAGAPLEVDQIGAVELVLGERRHARFRAGGFHLRQDVEAWLIAFARLSLVLLEILGLRLLGGLGRAHGER